MPPINDYGVSQEDVDSLYKQYESGELDTPAVEDDTPQEGESEVVNDEAVETKAPEAQKEPERITAKVPPEMEYEFNHNGKAIKAPLSQILKWAQQGYDYPQKMAELNRERQQLERLKDYQPIDEWVAANPDKWDKLREVIKAEQQGTADLPPQVAEKLSRFENFMSQWENEQQQKQIAQEDESLSKEIQSIQDEFKDLDWNTRDGNGRTREEAVLNHAVENGIKTFKAAFLDLYHKDLLKLAETKALERYAATKEANAKKGLLPNNKEAPIRLKPPATKNKNYEDTDSILKELGLG